MLDRVAAGDSLKSVCFDLNLGYEAAQKRICRWQQALGLKSTSVLLHVWATMRGFGTRPDDPTLLRYADLLRNTLGYAAPTRLPPAATVAIPANLSARHCPTPSASTVVRTAAEANTLALLSPALWRVALTQIRDGTYDETTCIGLPALHEWFLYLVGQRQSEASQRRLAAILSGWGQQDAGRHAMLTTDFQAVRAAHDLPSYHLLVPPRLGMMAQSQAESNRRVWLPKTGVSPFWRSFNEAAATTESSRLQAIWQSVPADHLLDPVVGLAAAVTFLWAKHSPVRAQVSPLINQMISTRCSLVLEHQVNPLQVLRRQACFDCGMSTVEHPDRNTEVASYPVLTAEQLLPQVKSLGVYQRREETIVSAPA